MISPKTVAVMALSSALAVTVSGMGHSIGECTLTQGYALQYIDISVQNPVTVTTETLRVTPKAVGSNSYAYATINAQQGYDVTVNYVFSQSILPVPYNGTNPSNWNTVTWVGFMHSNYNTGECVSATGLSRYLPSGGLTYADEGRDYAYTEGMFAALDSSRNTAGFKLAFNWFNATQYPGACGSSATHGSTPLTQCLVPDVLLGVSA